MESYAVILMTAIIIGVTGGVVISFGCVINRKNKKCSKLTTAKIIDIVSDARGMVAPVFAYRTFEGKEITVLHKFTGSPGLCKYTSGDTIKLFYNPQIPKQYHLYGKNRLGVFLICLGVLSLVSAGIMVILSYFILE